MNEEVFEDLVNLYLDKEISPQQLEILRNELNSNHVRSETFRSYCRMHQASHFAALQATPVVPTRRALSEVKSSSGIRRHHLGWTALAAALVLMTFSWVYLNGPFAKNRLANFTDNNSLRFGSAHFSNAASNQDSVEFFSRDEADSSLDAQQRLEAWLISQEREHWSRVQGDHYPQGLQVERGNTLPGMKYQYSNYEFKR